MNKLLVRFRVSFENFNYEEYERRDGPVFNRWLPNGIENALDIQYDDNTKLLLWFERRGKIEYQGGKPYVAQSNDPEDTLDYEVMAGAPALDAGLLYGMVEISNVDSGELEAVVNRKTDDAAYVALGKRLVTKVIYPYVRKLEDILRITYGQYWLSPFEKWDSRESSLGYYCKYNLGALWSVDQGQTWSEFLPNRSIANIKGRLIGKPHNDYLTENDWQDIQSLLNSDYNPSLGAKILTQANKRKDKGEYKYALIEAVTALEIALEGRVLNNIEGNKKLIEDIQNFWKLSMPAKLIIVSSLIGDISSKDVEDSIQAIYLRNNVAHEAKPVSEESVKLIETLMKTVSKILVDPSLKFPSMNMYRVTLPSPDF